MATQRIPGYNEFDFANAQLACSMLLGMDTIVSKFNAKARKLRADFARWSRPAPTYMSVSMPHVTKWGKTDHTHDAEIFADGVCQAIQKTDAQAQALACLNAFPVKISPAKPIPTVSMPHLDRLVLAGVEFPEPAVQVLEFLDMRTVAQQRDELTRGSSARVQAFAEWQNEVGNSITVSYLKEHGDRLTKKERATCWALVATPNFPPLVEHEAIMQPDLTYHDPSMYALEEHTGLANHPTPYLITKRIAPCDCGDYFTEGFPLPTATKHMSGGAGITQLERIIMEDCVMTAQGAPCLPHENKKPRPWFTNAGGIKKHYGLSTEQAEKIHESFQLIGPSVAAKSYPQVTDADIMAIHLMANALRECEPTDKDQTWVVLDEGEDDPLGESQELIMQLFDADAELQEAVTPADENIDDVPSPIEYHKLDDPRDEAPTWESRQSAEFHTELNKLRTMNMDELKAWGKSTHSTKKPSTPQMQVLWTEFFLRKAQLTPSIRPYAKAIIDRCQLTPQIGKANFWLYNEGKRTLTPTEQAAAWKVLKARETKRPVQYEIPEIPDNLEESYI